MVFRQYATELHIELHLICSIVCALCHAMLHLTGHASYLVVHHAMVMCWLFTMLFAPFPVLFLRVGSDNVAFVRIRSTTSVCLRHGLVLLPCGISGKMIIPSKSLLSLLSSCSLFCYAYAAIPTTYLSCLPYCEPSL